MVENFHQIILISKLLVYLMIELCLMLVKLIINFKDASLLEIHSLLTYRQPMGSSHVARVSATLLIPEAETFKKSTNCAISGLLNITLHVRYLTAPNIFNELFFIFWKPAFFSLTYSCFISLKKFLSVRFHIL